MGFAVRVGTRTMTPAIAIISLENSNQFSDNVKKKKKKEEIKSIDDFSVYLEKLRITHLKIRIIESYVTRFKTNIQK